MKTLNIIGAGKLGKTLGYLFQHKKQFKIQNVVNKTLASAQVAVDFIGAGEALEKFADLHVADVYLLAVSDDHIASVCECLIAEHAISEQSIVFHCSGALASAELITAKRAGASIASAHPIFSFSEPDPSALDLTDITCTLEGDAAACQVLRDVFMAIGMRTLAIEAKNKLLYHASLVMASNYVTVLMAAAIKGLKQSGISEGDALQILQPMVMRLMSRLFAVGPLQVLTGPIVRGDNQLVAQELKALSARDPHLATLYNALGNYTLTMLN